MRPAIWLAMLLVLVGALVLLFAEPLEEDDEGLWTPATVAPAVPTDVP